MSTKTNTFYLAAPLNLEPGEDEKLPSRMSGVAYSGGVADDSFGALVIDLATTKIADHLPLLYEHQREQTVGVVKMLTNDTRQLGIEAELFSEMDPQAGSIARKAAAGLHWQLSIGLFGARLEERESAEINGQTFDGPITVLSGGTVREVSVVALGADASTNAEFFSAGSRQLSITHEDNTMPEAPDLQARVDALETQVSDLAAERDSALERAKAAEQAMADIKMAARKNDVQSLFNEIGREFKDETAAHYLSMDDGTFAAIAKDLRDMKPKAPAHLFSEQATGAYGGMDQAEGSANLSIHQIYDNYNKAQRGEA